MKTRILDLTGKRTGFFNQTIKARFARKLARPLLLLLFAATQALAQTHYVTPNGSAAPEHDEPARPWQLVEAAALALQAGGGTLSLGPGLYREAFTLTNRAVLIAPSGPAKIGPVSEGVTNTTTFTVLAWNTHLFGDNLLLPSWMDYERAEEIGHYLWNRSEELDLVALCEVWDEDLFTGGDGATGIKPLAGYPFGLTFTHIKGGLVAMCGVGPIGVPAVRTLHSGLAMMTRHPFSAVNKTHYDKCAGDCPCPALCHSPDCLASKGFMGYTVSKDGFAIRIYSTHTQADNNSDSVQARESQIAQLADEIAAHRAANPNEPVIVMGDFNVIGERWDQYDYFRDRFGAIGGLDAARNAAGDSIYHNYPAGFTLLRSNELAVYFDSHTEDQRLDYVWYFPSLDGKVRIQPLHVHALQEVRSRYLMSGFGSGTPDMQLGHLTSAQLSDHYPIEACFRLDRVR